MWKQLDIWPRYQFSSNSLFSHLVAYLPIIYINEIFQSDGFVISWDSMDKLGIYGLLSSIFFWKLVQNRPVAVRGSRDIVIPGLCSFAFFLIGCNLNFANAIAIISLSISSLQMSGGFANINDICPSYVTSVFAILNTMASLTSFLIIHFGGMVLEKNGNNQFSWALIFRIGLMVT